MSVNRSLSLCSFNLHGFKNGSNTASDLCKSFDLVLLQENWLRKDNLPDADFRGMCKCCVQPACLFENLTFLSSFLLHYLELFRRSFTQ